MCVLKVKDFPQILPYKELLLTTWFYSLDQDTSCFMGTEVQFRKMNQFNAAKLTLKNHFKYMPRSGNAG